MPVNNMGLGTAEMMMRMKALQGSSPKGAGPGGPHDPMQMAFQGGFGAGTSAAVALGMDFQEMIDRGVSKTPPPEPQLPEGMPEEEAQEWMRGYYEGWVTATGGVQSLNFQDMWDLGHLNANPPEVTAEDKRIDATIPSWLRIKDPVRKRQAPPTMDFSSAQPKESVVSRVMRSGSTLLGRTAQAKDTLESATRTVTSNPAMMESFRKALPFLQSAAGKVSPKAGKTAEAVLPNLADGKAAKAVLELAQEAGGTHGRRLCGAAMRGFRNGGFEHAVAEVSKTAEKVAASGGAEGILGHAAKALGKATPLIGNAANVGSLGVAVRGLAHGFRDPDATAGSRMAHVFHLATSVAGCFIPEAGAAGDVAFDHTKTAKAEKAQKDAKPTAPAAE